MQSLWRLWECCVPCGSVLVFDYVMQIKRFCEAFMSGARVQTEQHVNVFVAKWVKKKNRNRFKGTKHHWLFTVST